MLSDLCDIFAHLKMSLWWGLKDLSLSCLHPSRGTLLGLRCSFQPLPSICWTPMAVPSVGIRCCINYVSFFKRFRQEKGGRKGEKHPCVSGFHAPSAGDLAHNPGMCPDWESNQRLFGSQAGTQSTQPHQPGRFSFSFGENA